MLYLLLLSVVCCLLFFFGIGAYPLIGDSEGNYAELAREMIQLKDYIVPHLNYVPYLEKPPFFFWITALSYKLFGYNEAAARLWAVIPAFGLVLIAYFFGKRISGKSLGLRSALILATSCGFIVMSKICYMDMLFSFLIGLSLLLFYIGLRGQKKIYFYGFYVSLAFAVLTKGFAGVILPALAAAVYLTCSREWKNIGKMCVPGGIFIFIVIAAPWHIAAAIKEKQFLWYYFINEHLYRYLGIRYPKDYFHGPIYYHAVRVFALMFPWSVFIPAAVWLFIKKADKKQWLFPVVWFLTILAFFSISRAKANYYMLSGLVPMALLLGWIWDKTVLAARTMARDRIFPATFALFVTAGISAMIAIVIYPQIVTKNFAPAFLPKGMLILLFMTLGGALSAYYFFKEKFAASFLAFLAGAFAAGLLISQNIELLNKEKSAKEYAQIINKEFKEGDIIAIRGKYEKNSTASFYLRKRAYVVCDPLCVDGDLDFGSRYPENRKYFISWEDFLKMFDGPQRVFYITRESGDAQGVKERFPAKTDILLNSSGRTLITNRAK